MRVASRWRVLLQAIRILHTSVELTELDGTEFDGIQMSFHRTGPYLNVLNSITGEVLVIYGEDGTPEYLSYWAKEPMDVYGVGSDYELYERN